MCCTCQSASVSYSIRIEHAKFHLRRLNFCGTRASGIFKTHYLLQRKRSAIRLDGIKPGGGRLNDIHNLQFTPKCTSNNDNDNSVDNDDEPCSRRTTAPAERQLHPPTTPKRAKSPAPHADFATAANSPLFHKLAGS